MVVGCKNKKRRVRMDELPDEIVISILSRLPMDVAARAGLVSRKWLQYWHHIQVLNFDNPIAFNKMFDDALEVVENYPKVIKKARFDYLNWVNNVLDTHLGCNVVEFKLAYYLNIIDQRVVDSWVVWAFSKHVEKFHLDFTPPRVMFDMPDPDKHLYVLDLPLLKSCCNTKFHLTSLFLKSVDVTTQALECIIQTCGPTLDYLWIEKSNLLTSITDASLPSLKYFKLYNCPNLETIHIKAPKLVTFKYFSGWYPVLKRFSIENASMLSLVSIHVKDEECFFRVLRSLFKYFSQLEYLKLSWLITKSVSPVLDNYPVLANLKHLKLFVCISRERTFDSWVPFIGACPLLEKFTLELRGRLWRVQPKIVLHDKCPLLFLKTFEVKIFNGANVDLDIANFLLENAPSLQEMILHISVTMLVPLDLEAPLAGVGLELPPHVKLVMV